MLARRGHSHVRNKPTLLVQNIFRKAYEHTSTMGLCQYRRKRRLYYTFVPTYLYRYAQAIPHTGTYMSDHIRVGHTRPLPCFAPGARPSNIPLHNPTAQKGTASALVLIREYQIGSRIDAHLTKHPPIRTCACCLCTFAYHPAYAPTDPLNYAPTRIILPNTPTRILLPMRLRGSSCLCACVYPPNYPPTRIILPVRLVAYPPTHAQMSHDPITPITLARSLSVSF